MATTFVGIELVGENSRARHAAVVLQRRRNGVELSHWSCRINTDRELLEYLAVNAGSSGVIAVHGQGNDSSELFMQRIWRVLDYRLLFAIAPRHRTRALVRVSPPEVQRAFSSNPEMPPIGVLESVRGLAPAVDFLPLAQCLNRLPTKGNIYQQVDITVRAALCAYAALWCWWHGPAGYDVLGQTADDYRLAPRLMDMEQGYDVPRR